MKIPVGFSAPLYTSKPSRIPDNGFMLKMMVKIVANVVSNVFALLKSKMAAEMNQQPILVASALGLTLLLLATCINSAGQAETTDTFALFQDRKPPGIFIKERQFHDIHRVLGADAPFEIYAESAPPVYAEAVKPGDKVTIMTPGIEARLCPVPACGPDRHITRIPAGTVLTVESIEDFTIGTFRVKWFEVVYNETRGWISSYDTDKAQK